MMTVTVLIAYKIVINSSGILKNLVRYSGNVGVSH